jgi:Predicted RNA-binding protein homologous to eukaryotic snRNP
MQPKRELTSVDLAAVTSALGELAGARVDKVYLYPEALVRVRMRHHAHGRVELVIQVGPLKRIHTVDPLAIPDAPDRPPEFAKMLRSHLAGAELTTVSQVGFDRIVELGFSRPDGDRTLVAELFGDGNIALVDATGDVVQPLRTVRVTARSVAPGEPYSPPKQRIDPLRIDEETFTSTMRASDADIVRTLATQLNLGGRYAEELCARADVDGSTAIDAASDDALASVWAALAQLRTAIADGDVSPVIYRDDDRVVDVAPLRLESAADELEAEPVEDVLTAFEQYFAAYEPPASEEPDPADALAEEIARTERIIEQQEAAIASFAEEAARERARAEALYREYGLVDEIITAIGGARAADYSWAEIETQVTEADQLGPAGAAIVGIDGANGEVTVAIDDLEIPVDVSMGVERNADRRYQAAKEIEEKQAGAKEALARTETELADLQAADGPAQRASEPPTDRPVTERSHVPVRRAESWYASYRWFETTDGFLVIGGGTPPKTRRSSRSTSTRPTASSTPMRRVVPW